MDQFKMDLYEDEVFVFTPKGDLYKLPKGATVLDFAFMIHTKLGCSCTGAKVNGKNVPILIFPIMVLLVVIYIYYRIWHILPFGHLMKWCTTLVLLLPVGLFFGYMTARSENSSLWVNQIVSIVGTSWMIILLYLLMTFFVIDIARLFIPAIRPWFVNSLYGTIGITTFIVITFVGGNLWYHHKVRVPLNIQIDKPLKPIKVIVYTCIFRLRLLYNV